MLPILLASCSLAPPPASALSRRAVLLGAAPFALTRAPRAASALEDFVPPPLPPAEPEAARRLLALVDGRRPSDWSDAERPEIDKLIDELARLQAPWPRDKLVGKWKLAYLQPGPDGAGVDRRIPFPEFPFNDSFQRFGDGTVVNIGELLGPSLEVRVGGSLREDDTADLTSPKRFIASIDGGQLCAFQSVCAPLPIKGEGIFDGVYLGQRLRIGQNLNGGGARIVQVRVM